MEETKTHITEKFIEQKFKEKGRYLKRYLLNFYPDEYRYVIEATAFIIKPVSFSERVYY